jgi:type IV secretory pathway TrbL component
LNRLFKFVVCLLMCLGTTQTLFANDSFHTTQSGDFTEIGAGFMVGGGVLAAIGGTNGFESGGSAVFYSGIAMLGAGTGMLLWGRASRSNSLKFEDSLESAQSRSFIVGVSLLRKGGAAGAIIRW